MTNAAYQLFRKQAVYTSNNNIFWVGSPIILITIIIIKKAMATTKIQTSTSMPHQKTYGNLTFQQDMKI